MRLWKIVGLATLAGVVAAGVVVERKRRAYRNYDTDELRDRLHARLAAAGGTTADAGSVAEPLDAVGAALPVLVDLDPQVEVRALGQLRHGPARRPA